MNKTETVKGELTLVIGSLKTEAVNNSDHICHHCQFVMPSQNSSTGFRCGHQYFLVHPFLRKLTRMDHFPEVNEIHACTQWCEKRLTKIA